MRTRKLSEKELRIIAPHFFAANQIGYVEPGKAQWWRYVLVGAVFALAVVGFLKL